MEREKNEPVILSASKLANETDTVVAQNMVSLHGMMIPEEVSERVLHKRMEDVQIRYSSYGKLFKTMKLCFVHIPKTAGTSFEAVFFEAVGRNRSQHAPARYWRQALGAHDWETSFKFAIVRHPFHRLVSGYTYWKNGALSGQEVDQPFVYRCRSQELNTLTKFVDYLVHVHENGLWDKRDIQGYDGSCPIQFRPQTWFLSEEEDDKDDGIMEPCNVVGNIHTISQESQTHVNMSNDDRETEEEGGGQKKEGGKKEKEKEKEKGELETKNRLIPFDFIGRYEDLAGTYAYLCKYLEDRQKQLSMTHPDNSERVGGEGEEFLIPNLGKPLPHTRASLHPRELPDEFKDPSFVAKVVKIYGSDFDAFGYEAKLE